MARRAASTEKHCPGGGRQFEVGFFTGCEDSIARIGMTVKLLHVVLAHRTDWPDSYGLVDIGQRREGRILG